jgi:ATP-dependent DNA ligase
MPLKISQVQSQATESKDFTKSLFGFLTVTNQVVLLLTELIAQIEFTEWTPDGHLRHSKFVGVREDKNAREAVRRVRSPHVFPASLDCSQALGVKGYTLGISGIRMNTEWAS